MDENVAVDCVSQTVRQPRRQLTSEGGVSIERYDAIVYGSGTVTQKMTLKGKQRGARRRGHRKRPGRGH